MTKLLLAAGVAALAIVSPAAADPGKNGKGDRAERVKSSQQQRVERRSESRTERRAERMRVARADRGDNDRRRVARARDRDDDRRVVKLRDRDDDRRVVKVRNRDDERRRVVMLRDRDDDRRVARMRDWNDDRFVVSGRGRALLQGCPPGLDKQNELCMPPGQYKKRMTGQLLPAAYSDKRLPQSLRNIYRDTDDHYWRYGDNGYLYQVNRQSNLINSLLPLIGGGYGVGQAFPTSYMNSYVPDYYRAFYPDTSDDYYRYANGYVYEIDRNSGMIEDLIPMYGYGYGVGQMLPASYGYYNLPSQYRGYYQDSGDHYYRYAPGSIYQVDRGSNLITQIVSLLAGDLGVGSRLPMGYDAYNVPMAYRDQYYDTNDAWYRYNDGNIYQVDPTTRLITAVIQAIT